MIIEYDRAFLKEAKKLPFTQQKLLVKKFALLSGNPFDSHLHTKQLSTPLEGIFSFRISREYRALFRFVDAEHIFVFSVKHRKDVYR
jgi:mRNA-degrading endonuclease RelE of RelBE toxin-antitoxin system